MDPQDRETFATWIYLKQLLLEELDSREEEDCDVMVPRFLLVVVVGRHPWHLALARSSDEARPRDSHARAMAEDEKVLVLPLQQLLLERVDARVPNA